MGLVYKKRIKSETTVGLWKVKEDIDELLSIFVKLGGNAGEIEDIHHEHRKKQIICSRMLAGNLLDCSLPVIRYENGAPALLNSNRYISISHSGDLVSAIVSFNPDIGIDIEKITDRIKKIATRFLHPEEQKMLSDNHELEQLYAIWCSKEALFKLYKKGGLVFKENIRIEPFKYSGSGRFSGFIDKDGENRKYFLNYMEFNEYMVVYTVNE